MTCIKFVNLINSFAPQSSPIGEVILLARFYWREHWVTEISGYFFGGIPWLLNSSTQSETQAGVIPLSNTVTTMLHQNLFLFSPEKSQDFSICQVVGISCYSWWGRLKLKLLSFHCLSVQWPCDNLLACFFPGGGGHPDFPIPPTTQSLRQSKFSETAHCLHAASGH